jgi:hypothetical protein
MLSVYAEDAVFDFSAVFTDVEPMRGQDNMSRYWMELRETWKGIGLEPVEGFDLGDGRFILEMRLSGVGKRSGWGGTADRRALQAQAGGRQDRPRAVPS